MHSVLGAPQTTHDILAGGIGVMWRMLVDESTMAGNGASTPGP